MKAGGTTTTTTTQKKKKKKSKKRASSAASSSSCSSPPLTASQLTPLFSLLSSSVSLSLRFLSLHDLLLLPSQTLSLDSSLHAAALSLSRLLSLLPLSLQTLTLTTLSLAPPPSPSSSPSPSPSLPSSWFLRFLSSPDSPWLDCFRMSKLSFYLLLQALSPSLNPNSHNSHNSPSLPLPPDHKLGAALFRLAHAAPFRAVARRFGLPSPAVACRAFYEVCRAVADQISHLFDLADDLPHVVLGFSDMALPTAAAPLASRASPSKALSRQAPSSPRASSTPTAASSTSPGSSVPRYIIGPSCCPLLPWLVTPFGKHDSEPNSSKCGIFNHIHARGTELAEGAFRLVKARWQLLSTTWKEECADALPYVVIAGCLLHNYLIKRDEPLLDEVEVGVEEEGFPDFEERGDEVGERIREVIASHLNAISQ
uniref:DDE Tnp4 domain-containing protein n=1 Tax=Ananas comosus var. bracteatus TaxID=296719 RepID=A0A6V7P4G3_ANACO|nr:unnamed protein product [Ananas comosus var. bracteatus]